MFMPNLEKRGRGVGFTQSHAASGFPQGFRPFDFFLKWYIYILMEEKIRRYKLAVKKCKLAVKPLGDILPSPFLTVLSPGSQHFFIENA
jgi:hypothetical protein